MITTSNLTFYYDKTMILDGISWSAPSGNITYLAGINGTGKTTWVKCAVGLLTPVEGKVQFDGACFEDVREKTAICFDTPPVYKHMSCVDNLKVLYDADYAEDEVRQMAEAIGLSDYLMTHPAGKLSYGQRHRLGILGALARKAPYIILDEPDLGLDPFAWEFVCKMLHERKNMGDTIILTGQNFQQLQQMIDHVSIISERKILFDSSIQDLMDEYGKGTGSLKEAFYNIVGKRK